MVMNVVYRVLKFLLGITDYTFIEESCAVNLHSHSRTSIWGFSYGSTDVESVNIFVLAVNYGRYVKRVVVDSTNINALSLL